MEENNIDIVSEVQKELSENGQPGNGEQAQEQTKEEKPKKIDLGLIITTILKSYTTDDEKSRQLRPSCNKLISKFLSEEAEEYDCSKKNIIFF